MKISTNFGGNFRPLKSGLFLRCIVSDIVEIKFTQWQMVKKIKKPPQPLLKHKIFTESKRKEDAAKKQKIIRNFACAPFVFGRKPPA